VAEQKKNKLNWLERHLPDGLVVDAAWLGKHGYSTSLRSQYVKAGWLEQPARQVYRRRQGSLVWQRVVISLQTLLECPLAVGGRTALELQGYAHYLASETKEVHLYGPERPPHWLNKLPLKERFVYHNSDKLFPNEPITCALTNPNLNADPLDSSLTTQFRGQDDWLFTLSTPERATLELLDQLPGRESFHQADMLFEGLGNLSPKRMQKLLADCRSVKVKRLFFFFADRHQHAWLKRLSKKPIDLGKGKRLLVKGGKLDGAYQITVPQDMNAVR
jgi:Transcriptional regulator, AbiEi antitoxin, Type IV TA system/Transcriptional regulator, AbiEi antitoxin N-terminal domain